MSTDFEPIPGTHRNVWPETTPAAELDSDADVLLTAWLRPRRGGELDVERAQTLGATMPARRAYLKRSDVEQQTTADPHDVDLLRRYCEKFGIDVVETHWRSVVLRGPLQKSVKAFGATAAIYETPDKRRFRHRCQALHAPSEIAAILRGPFGIHQWPRSHAIAKPHAESTPLSKSEIEARYRFPDSDGDGQTVGILQLRGTFKADDFTKCMQVQGIKAALPTVKRVDNAELTHGIETAKDVESAIDTQIVAGLAPGADIVVYAAPDDERGVLDAIRTALFDDEKRPSILSISFGFPERLWTPLALTILDELFTVAALIGVSVFCASGDNGAELDSSGRPQVLAPASSAFAQACGGTKVASDASAPEIAWENTGGGFSGRFDAPRWQKVATSTAAAYGIKPGRGVPDFAAQVVPGYAVCLEGAMFAGGGTSAVAPVWSALAARLNERLGSPIGFFAPLLYDAAAGSLFRAITSGSNGFFRGAAGWNPCTGLGAPRGDAIERALRHPV